MSSVFSILPLHFISEISETLYNTFDIAVLKYDLCPFTSTPVSDRVTIQKSFNYQYGKTERKSLIF